MWAFFISDYFSISQGVRGVLRNSEDVTDLLQDWRTVDVEAMIMQPEACNTNMELFRECEFFHAHFLRLHRIV